MPTYDGRCKQCKRRYEFFTPIKDRDKAECPFCGSPLFRVPAAPNVHTVKPFVEDNIDGTPRVVSSRKQLKEIIHRHNETHPGDHLTSTWLEGNPLDGKDGKPEAKEPPPLRELQEFRVRKKVGKRLDIPQTVV